MSAALTTVRFTTVVRAVSTPDAIPIGRLRRGEPQALDDLGLLVGAEEEVHRRVLPGEAGTVELADRASGEDDPHRRVGGLQVGQPALAPDHLRLGGLADRRTC